MAEATELRALDPRPETGNLISGLPFQYEELRSRQFFKLARILTHGSLPILQDGSLLDLKNLDDPAEFAQRFLVLLLIAIPDAEEETVQFLRSMLKPVGLIEGRRLNKQDMERNTELWYALELEIDNPCLEDTVTIVEGVVRREADNIQALGKRLMAMFRLAEKTGQLQPRHSATTTSDSSADSPAASIFYQPSTDGPTTTSVSYLSGGSASVSPSFGSDGITSSGNETNG